MRRIFSLYLDGDQLRAMGTKDIAVHLNSRNITLRGQRWCRNRVHEILSSRTYIGEYYFNKRDHKTKAIKPESEWIKLEMEPIIDAATFEAARSRRAARAPAMVPPRVVNSPTLLTGLLKCGGCGAGMTLATGKGGRYRYYKCNTKISKGVHLCNTPAIPMQKLDGIVLEALADRVFTPDRVGTMLDEMRKQQRETLKDQEVLLRPLQKEMDSLKLGTDRLYEAVEKGLLPMDETLQQRAHKLQARRQEVLIEIAGWLQASERNAARPAQTQTNRCVQQGTAKQAAGS